MHSHGRLLFWLLFCYSTHKDEPPGQGSPERHDKFPAGSRQRSGLCPRRLVVVLHSPSHTSWAAHPPVCKAALLVTGAAMVRSSSTLRALLVKISGQGEEACTSRMRTGATSSLRHVGEVAPVPVASLLHLHARPSRERPVTSIPQSLRLGSLLPAHQPPRNHVYGYTDDSAWPSACKPLLGPMSALRRLCNGWQKSDAPPVFTSHPYSTTLPMLVP
ncbi:hypothetical protein J3E73DRAFT_435190 [Bipolaris maydis]|nr:hypothetical protein J3E73DRAFT_435190 [Bipolaris maydis]